jgi:hypothetical protein
MTFWLMTSLFGYSSWAVLAMLALQHLLLILALLYCLRGLRSWGLQIAMSLALFVGMRAHIFSHGAMSEAFAFGFMIIFLGAFIRIGRRGDLFGRAGLRDVTVYHVAFALMILARISLATMGLCLPLYFLVKFAMAADRRTARQFFVSLAAGLCMIAASIGVTTGVLKLVGASTESVFGRPGVYRIQSLPWAQMSAAERAALIGDVQSRTTNDFVRQIIPILIDTKNPWVGPWRAVDALRRQQNVAIGTDDAMTAGYFAFMKTMNHHIAEAIFDDVMRYFDARGVIAGALKFSQDSLTYYRSAEDWPLARDMWIVNGTNMAAYDTFLRNPAIRAIDAIPAFLPFLAALAALIALSLVRAADRRMRPRIEANALVMAGCLLLGVLVYVVLSGVVNIISLQAYRYTVPVSGLSWAAVALLAASYRSRPLENERMV